MAPVIVKGHAMRARPSRLALSLALSGLAAASGAAAPPPPPPPAVLHCDGHNDDTLALNQGVAKGGLITLPAGTCMVSGTVQLPAGTTLVGAGTGKTIIRAFAEPQADLIEAHGKIDLSNLTVDGNAHQMNLNAANIRLQAGSDGSNIHDLETMNSAAPGIVVQGSNTTVQHIASHDNWKQGIYVIGVATLQSRISNVLVANNTLHRNVLGLSLTGAPGDGIDIDRLTKNVTVRNNTVYDNDIILFEDGSNADSAGVRRASGHIVTGNHVFNSQANGADVAGSVDSFTISGNTFSNNTNFGILVHGDNRGGKIVGNTITGTTNEGIDVAPLATTPPASITITGNTIQGVPAGFAAVDLKFGTHNVTVSGNFLTAPVLTITAGSNVTVANNP